MTHSFAFRAGLAGLLALVLLGHVQAQPANPNAPQVTNKGAETCNVEMAKFSQALDFVRDAQGQQAAAQLKERLLPTKLESELLSQGGTCAVVGYLRSKRLLS